MNVYIDFEASDDQSIISVGCVDETGRTFYSLVHSDDVLTNFISNLTGISQEMIADAPEIDEVFENLYDWCSSIELPTFYCYGTSDIDFVSNGYNDVYSFKAACMLGYIYTGMIDYSEEVKQHFCVGKTISLEKVSNYYLGEEALVQNHNALDDAIRLKLVYEKVSTTPKEINVFNEYLESFVKKPINEIHQILRMRDNEVVETYETMDEAVKWVLSQPNEKDNKYITNIPDKIRRASLEKIKYFKFNWRVI